MKDRVELALEQRQNTTVHMRTVAVVLRLNRTTYQHSAFCVSICTFVLVKASKMSAHRAPKRLRQCRGDNSGAHPHLRVAVHTSAYACIRQHTPETILGRTRTIDLAQLVVEEPRGRDSIRILGVARRRHRQDLNSHAIC